MQEAITHDVVCSHAAALARECAIAGVVINWRDSVLGLAKCRTYTTVIELLCL